MSKTKSAAPRSQSPGKPPAKKAARTKRVAQKSTATRPSQTSPAVTQESPPPSNKPNPFAPEHWPHKRESTVYFLTNPLTSGGRPQLATGVVWSYNYAVADNGVVTKGRPVVGVLPAGGDGKSVAVCGLDAVAEFTPEGKRKLEGVLFERLIAMAAECDRKAQELRREAALYTKPGVAPLGAQTA